jgi:hypothetical protein
MEIIGRQVAGEQVDDDEASWADVELSHAGLGDKRLDRRLVRIAKSLAAAPQDSIPTASDGLAETVAAYRFFDNEKVTLDKVLKPHVQRTYRRMRKHPIVLLAQDTTELDYTGCSERHRNSGPLSRRRQLGYYLHPSIAFTPEGVCLGTLNAKLWARDPETFGTSRETVKQKPIEEKESYRWLEGWEVVSRAARAVPQSQVISVSDRESDIYALLSKATTDGTPNARFVIRQRDDRCLTERVDEADSRAYRKVSSALVEAPPLGTITVDVPRSKKSKARLATVEIRSAAVTLKHPRIRRRDEETELTVNVVWAIERDVPEDADGIEWILFTDLPCATLDEAVQVVEYYAGRWGIEVFFRVFKSGCKVEELQLETRDRLEPCLGLYLIIAWRVLHMVMLGRQCPNLPCDVLLTESEWQSAWTIRKQTPLPASSPGLAEMIAIVASFGCYLGRKGDGPPGPKAIWIGLRRTMDFALAWNTFGPKNRPANE